MKLKRRWATKSGLWGFEMKQFYKISMDHGAPSYVCLTNGGMKTRALAVLLFSQVPAGKAHYSEIDVVEIQDSDIPVGSMCYILDGEWTMDVRYCIKEKVRDLSIGDIERLLGYKIRIV